MPVIIYSEQFLDHETGSGHPECPERLLAIVEALKTVPWQEQLIWQLPTSPENRDVLSVVKNIHTPELLSKLETIASKGGGRIDLDTYVSAASYEIALLAVSAWLDGVDTVLSTGNPTFVLARPPGHHATRDAAMGFCLLSNAAIAAHYALSKPGINRVGILDWDVHHGNGTEAIVETNPLIAYCSLHQYPCYPGTGKASDRGLYNNILNIPMVPGSTLAQYQPAFEKQVLPFFQNFRPDCLIISAGYDANHQDPLAEISLKPQDYGTLTRYCFQISSRLLFGLEGGYHLQALADSVVATLANCL